MAGADTPAAHLATAVKHTLVGPGVPPEWFVEQALCVHSGWHYTHVRASSVRAPEYVLWRHGYWRTWKTWANGEGPWTGTVGSLYGGGMSFTVGTWNRAGAPYAASTYDIARASPAEQIRRSWVIVQGESSRWSEWPQTSRACGYR